MDAQRIQALRKRLGWTQKRLAEELGACWQTVNRWENGHFQPKGMSLKLLQQLDAQSRKGGADKDE